MGTVELKHIISEHLSHIEDKSFLQDLKNLLESKVASETYTLNDFEKQRIEMARKQFKKGETISNEKIHSQIQKWFDTK
jgi:ABC-type transport system involved in Fe-S cluster assembly fused permease/ATPase subunit